MWFNKKISWNFTIQLILPDELRQLLQKSRCQGHFVNFSCTCPNKELKCLILMFFSLDCLVTKNQILNTKCQQYFFVFISKRGEDCLGERSLMMSLVFWPFLTYLPTMFNDFYPIKSDIWRLFWTPYLP